MSRSYLRVDRRGLLAIVVGAALAPWPDLALGPASPATAERVSQDLVGQIWATLRTNGVEQRRRVEQLSALIEARTDVPLLSRLVLGRYWQQLADQQRHDYEKLFREVVIRSLARRLDGYADAADGSVDDRFQIVASSPAGKNDVLVRSKVIPRQGKPLALDWRLRQRDQGPVIIDLIVEGASLLVSQRSEFAAVIERSNLDGLLAELRARASSSQS
jgi:phospholipid transport system substrate-binding protein